LLYSIKYVAQKKRLPVIEERKIFQIGGSLAVTIPSEWLEQTGLKAGSTVTVIANNEIRIVPSSPKLVERLHEMVEKSLKELEKEGR